MHHVIPTLHPLNLIAPALAGLVFIAIMSLVPEPGRHKINVILVAGAGAAYMNGGLGFWEYPYVVFATILAYKALGSYRYVAVAWLCHTCWDVVHHLYGTPIWPWDPTSSAGCGVFDAVIAVWFWHRAPSAREMLAYLRLSRRPGESEGTID